MPLLNIGEDTTDGRKVLPEKVLAALHLAGALPTEFTGYISDTEYTHVVKIPRELSEREVRDLAIVLDQEAIAYWQGGPYTGRGFLAGPSASKWGSFDPTRFLLLDGSRLSDIHYKAA